MRNRLKQVTERWIRQLWQLGHADDVDELHTPGFCDHSPGGGRAGDNDGFKQGIREFYQAFPDFYTIIEDLVIDLDCNQVAVRWSATGTHRGTYLGVPATGRALRFTGIEILTVSGDRVAERWGEWDLAALLQQLDRPVLP